MYHSTYAFFVKPPQLFDVASALVAAFEQGFRVVLADEEDEQQAVFEPEASGRAVPQQPTWPVASFWLDNQLSSMEGRLWSDGFLDIKLHVYDGTLRGDGESTPSQKHAKYKTALALHRTLIERCGAVLSFTTGLHDNTPGPIFPIDQAAAVAEALKASNRDDLSAAMFGSEMPSIWLLSIDPTRQLTAPLTEQFPRRDKYRVVEHARRVVIFEDQLFRPPFLRWEEEEEQVPALR